MSGLAKTVKGLFSKKSKKAAEMPKGTRNLTAAEISDIQRNMGLSPGAAGLPADDPRRRRRRMPVTILGGDREDNRLGP